MSIASDFEKILLAFNARRTEYMIAGGYSVNFYGYNRSTSDLDIWVKPIESNKIKICEALEKLGFSESGIGQVKKIDFTKPFSFIIGNEPIDVDVFNFITGVSYEAAEKNAVSFHYSKKLIMN